MTNWSSTPMPPLTMTAPLAAASRLLSTVHAQAAWSASRWTASLAGSVRIWSTSIVQCLHFLPADARLAHRIRLGRVEVFSEAVTLDQAAHGHEISLLCPAAKKLRGFGDRNQIIAAQPQLAVRDDLTEFRAPERGRNLIRHSAGEQRLAHGLYRLGHDARHLVVVAVGNRDQQFKLVAQRRLIEWMRGQQRLHARKVERLREALVLLHHGSDGF